MTIHPDMHRGRWVILSPHLDDAVLSCGGLIAALRNKVRVEIWTLFSSAPFRGPYSPVARWLHGVSGGSTGSRLVWRRRSEDRAAGRLLGARCRHFMWQDAVYRKASDGSFLYVETQVPDWHHDDDRLLREMIESLRTRVSEDDVLLVPLAIGGHVDHLIVRRACEELGHAPLFYYPDVPYVQSYSEELVSRTNTLRSVRYEIGEEELRDWISGVKCYATQVPMLEEAAGPLSDLIERRAAGRGLELYAASDVPLPKLDIWQSSVNMGSTKARSLAPIAVFAFRRLDLLRQTLSALEQCNGFESSRVHVFSDGGRAHREDEVAAVREVRLWLKDWCDRHRAELHPAPANQGLRVSITSGVSTLLAAYDRVIVLEDDIIVSPSFLTFMNEALDTYDGHANVFQVSGYFVPHKESLPAIGFLGVPACWGWATWRRAWQYYRDDAQELLAEVHARDTYAFDIRGSYGYLDALERNAAGTLNTWMVRWYASVFLQRGLTIYPGRSLTRNIGFGDEGTNCGPGTMAHVFATQPIDTEPLRINWNSVPIQESSSFLSALEGFYRWQQHQWTKPSWRQRLTARLRLVTGTDARA